VRTPEFAKRKEYNGTNIRSLIIAGKKEEWKHLVPPAIAKAIEDVGGVERMKVLARSDSDPARW
jgi:nicotinamide-nucleotide adenylyltransferase